MPAGRPTVYNPDFCETVVKLGRQGKSKAVMAAEIGVTKQTLENWARAHPEFFDAMALAITHAQAWWENAGQKGLTADRFNGSVWSRSMAARFPEDWRENSRHEHTGAGGGPIQHVDLSGVSDDDLARLEKLLGPLVGVGEGGAGEEGAGG